MLRMLARLAAAIGLVGALTACQTTSPALNDPATAASLAQAGFEQVASKDPSAAGYICPTTRCGGLVVIVRGSQQMPGDARTSLTVEDAVKSDAYKESGVKTLFSKFLSEQNGEVTLTSLRIDRKRAEIHINFVGGNGRTKGQGVGLLVIRGNHLGGLVAISENRARAQRYLRRQWVP